MMPSGDLVQRIRQPVSEDDYQAALYDLGAWAVTTCLVAGAQASTAYQVAAALVDGIQRGDKPAARRQWPRRQGGAQ